MTDHEWETPQGVEPTVRRMRGLHLIRLDEASAADAAYVAAHMDRCGLPLADVCMLVRFAVHLAALHCADEFRTLQRGG